MRVKYVEMNKKMMEYYCVNPVFYMIPHLHSNHRKSIASRTAIYTYYINLCTIYPYGLPSSVIVDCYVNQAYGRNYVRRNAS